MSSNQINYKQKYQELKSKFMESVDTAFRLGYEQGAQQAAIDQAAQQKQQEAEMQAQAMQGANGPDFSGGGAEGSQPGAEQQANPNASPDSQNPAGSELDQHIAKLESMLKGELKADDLQKSIDGIRALQVKMVQEAELKKSAAAIPAIAKALHKPAFKIGKQASHNMNSNAKAAVSMQHQIVEGIMKSWEAEESEASKKVNNILNIEGLTKKENV